MTNTVPLFDAPQQDPIAIKLSDLLGSIRGVLQRSFSGTYWVIAEVSNVHYSSHNGHVYLDLVESDHGVNRAYVRGNLWSSVAARVLPRFREVTGENIAPGMELMLLVKVDMHPQYGISLTIYDINPDHTLGHLERLRQETIRRLQQEGIWDLNKSQFLPTLIQSVAVISSPTAAGWGDFQKQISESRVGSLIRLSLFPATMQGNNTTRTVHEALNSILESNVEYDAVVIIRGGGSKMDLSAFDDYHLCCIIANFPLPIITGIGHERDQSVADMVAHTPQKTPTAVADFLIRRMELVVDQIFQAEQRLLNVSTWYKEQKKSSVSTLYQRALLVLRSLQQKPILALQHQSSRLEHLVSLKVSYERNTIQRLSLRSYHIFSRIKDLGVTLLSLSVRGEGAIKLLVKQVKSEEQRWVFNSKRLIHVLQTMQQKLVTRREQYERLTKLYDPSYIMQKGFLPVTKSGERIQNLSDLKVGDELSISLDNGVILTKIENIQKKNG